MQTITLRSSRQAISSAKRHSSGMSRAFDSHFHVIDPAFPLVANHGYMPAAFTALQYKDAVSTTDTTNSTTSTAAGVNVVGGAVVSGSFQLYDQEYLKHALSVLNRGRPAEEGGYCGVANIEKRDDQLCEELHAAGVRAVRFNVARLGVGSDAGASAAAAQDADAAAAAAAEIARILTLGTHLHDVHGWHSEFYIDPSILLSPPPLEQHTPYMDLLLALPVITIDHCGLTATGLPALLQLLRERAPGTTFVKLTGFGRYKGTAEQLRSTLLQLLASYPDQLMWATDLPGTRAPRAYGPEDLQLVDECLQRLYPAEVVRSEVASKVMIRNAQRLYGVGFSA